MIKKSHLAFMLLSLALPLSSVSHAGWQDLLKGAAEELVKSPATTEVSSGLLNNNEMIEGLKEALANGVESSIKTLGKRDGFLGNELVKIPVPDSLKMIEKTARNLGQGQLADNFVTTINHAAEQAVPEAAEILAEAIRKMTIEDARKILNGPDDAATQYFRSVSEEQLTSRFRPIVENATNQTGVTSAYKTLVGQASPLLNNSMLGTLAPQDALDIDKYVTNKALDGLFKYIAIEEKRIRENPAARTTDLLKKVFSK